MRNKKMKLFLVVVTLAIVSVSIIKIQQTRLKSGALKEASPFFGTIRIFISCTGTVLPKNRLELKPPVNGRIEKILVKEGDKVEAGQILAWMSSTERAALLDAARGKGEETLEYWEQAYKSIPLSAPIDGEVIVATTQPGQAVNTSDAVLVLSDHLIVRAQVDETDIGKITPGMKAVMSLDAYPDVKIGGFVEHIYYESRLVNNVTMYAVDLKPEEVPAFFRSGMNASVDFMEYDNKKALLIPVEAVYKENGESYVITKKKSGRGQARARVVLGETDGRNKEVISGITEKDIVVFKAEEYVIPRSDTGRNPFLPSRRR